MVSPYVRSHYCQLCSAWNLVSAVSCLESEIYLLVGMVPVIDTGSAAKAVAPFSNLLALLPPHTLTGLYRNPVESPEMQSLHNAGDES